MFSENKLINLLASRPEEFENFKSERDEKKIFNLIYNEIRASILNNKKGYGLGAARDLFLSLSPVDAKKVLEMFNKEEGTLPDELGDEYIKLAYSPESLEAKMKEGKNFYEALSIIAWEIKGAHISLNPELVALQVKKSEAELLKSKEAEPDQAESEDKTGDKV